MIRTIKDHKDMFAYLSESFDIDDAGGPYYMFNVTTGKVVDKKQAGHVWVERFLHRAPILMNPEPGAIHLVELFREPFNYRYQVISLTTGEVVYDTKDGPQ